jgi:hypothetical protein
MVIKRAIVIYGLDLLSRPKATDILMAFFENAVEKDANEFEWIPLKELAKMVRGSNSTVNARLKDLIHAGLLEEWYEEEFHGRRFLKLSELGVEVAFELWKIDYMMSGGPPGLISLPKFMRYRLKDFLKLFKRG